MCGVCGAVSYNVMYTSGIKGLGPVEYVSQKWPVNPNWVVVRNTSSNGNFAQLFVDGQKVAKKNVPGRRSVVFEGIPTGEGIQELLFALPRCRGPDRSSDRLTRMPD
ncbi:unnamed protein product [Ectocarpus sp. 8 AP-2014]